MTYRGGVQGLVGWGGVSVVLAEPVHLQHVAVGVRGPSNSRPRQVSEPGELPGKGGGRRRDS